MFLKKFYSKMLSIFLAGLFLLTGIMPAKAAPLTSPMSAGVTFIVNSTLDQPDDLTMPGTCHTAANTCTLRAAIMQANRTSGVGATIILPAGTYTLTIPAAGADGEENGDLNLTTPISGTPTITISGAGADSTFIDINQLDRVFKIHTGRTATISGVTIMDGYASLSHGGGVYNEGTLTVTNSAILGNYADLRGGGIYNPNPGVVTITNSKISENSASEKGGGILNYNFMTVIDSTISGNSAANGGGIFSTTKTLMITNSTVSGNSAENGGGGIAIDINGTSNISASTISGNFAMYGGGIFNLSAKLITITNSTVAGNQASRHGGGVYNDGTEGTTHTYIYNTSVVFNAADMNDGDAFTGEGGGIYNKISNSTFLHLTNSLVAGNTAGVIPVYDDCFGTLYAQGNNLIGAASVSPNGDSCTIDTGYGDYALLNDLSLLGSLQNNGGSTETVALLPGSNAIDSGTPTYGCVGHDSVTLTTDQRGVARPQGSWCDIGAFEKTNTPTSATFEDVPMNHPYWEDIEILYANGYTAGCSSSPLLFCPETTMNRAQSAVFMVRGNFGISYSPPAAPWATFGDDFAPGPWAQPWAQGMFDAGLTAGCSSSPRLFCPWEEMPRFQAAVFGMRLKEGINYPPPAGTGTVFADINGSEWFAGWVEQAYLNGLLPACGSSGGKPLFCPNDLVSRGLAAYMIVRAKSLSMP